ncbi:MAG TPA: glycogen-binding domain-containing protein [Tepidisphaeraceae bacterium]|nr:glycogen-binding domain-containing protein [Tepidisphaeraceae bacterium]
MTKLIETGRVEFRFFRPGASIVKVAGEFTRWDREPLAMQSSGDGWWTAAAAIDPGEYRFRYVADGKWYTDFAANGVEATRAGWNSVLVVP